MSFSSNKNLTLSLNTTSPVFGTVLPIMSEFSTEKSLHENYLLKDEKDYSNKSTKTKIICTFGPKTDSEEMMAQLIDNGMDIARFNLTHGDESKLEQSIARLRKVASEKKVLCPVILDTKGTALRMAKPNSSEFEFRKGERVILRPGDVFSTFSEKNEIVVNEMDIANIISVGEVVTIGFGLIELKATKVAKDHVECEVLFDGKTSSRENIFLPRGRKKHSVDLCSTDVNDIKFAAKVKAEFLSVSYVASADHLRKFRSAMQKNNCEDISLIAKIECHEALLNFDEILEESDGIIISRGNLGEEIELESVTLAQKLIVRKCNALGKPVVVATQLLESMCTNPFPTRAEASDMGNAVFDGTDGVMLKAETAVGKYPIKSVKMSSVICKEAERSVNHEETFYMIHKQTLANLKEYNSEEAIASSAVKMSFDLNSSMLVVKCRQGITAQLLAKYRPKCPILLITDCEKSARKSFLWRGVTSVVVGKLDDEEELTKKAIAVGKKLNLCKDGDTVVELKSNQLYESNGVAIPNVVNVVRVK